MVFNHGEVDFIGMVESVEQNRSTVLVYNKYCEGLHRLSTFSHIIILYWFHTRDTKQNRAVLRVIPKMHKGAPEIGVFTSRSPSRPNPIGLCVTKLLSIEECRLILSGLDADEGSPIVDIKPYLPRADAIPDARVPEYMLRGPAT